MPAPVCAVIPALDEEATIAAVVADAARRRRRGHRRRQRLDRPHRGGCGRRRGARRARDAAGLRCGVPCRRGRRRPRRDPALPRRRRLRRPRRARHRPRARGLRPGAAGARFASCAAGAGRCGLAPHQALANRVAAAALIRARWRVGGHRPRPCSRDPPARPSGARYALADLRLATPDDPQGGACAFGHRRGCGRRPSAARWSVKGQRVAAGVGAHGGEVAAKRSSATVSTARPGGRGPKLSGCSASCPRPPGSRRPGPGGRGSGHEAGGAGV